jgi:hypothetical protein
VARKAISNVGGEPELLNSGRFLSRVTKEGIREVGDNFLEPEGKPYPRKPRESKRKFNE